MTLHLHKNKERHNNDFEYNYLSEDEDLLTLDDDFSFTTIILGSYIMENTIEEILLFTLDEIALQNAQELLNENNNNNSKSEEKISWKDIEDRSITFDWHPFTDNHSFDQQVSLTKKPGLHYG